MKLIRNLKKNEKGSVTLMVLTTMIFVLVILMASYFSVANKSRNQDKEIAKIVDEYEESAEDINQAYIDALNSSTILTLEQAQSNGMFEKTTNTEVIINEDYEKIVVPVGFKIQEINIPQGVVIIKDKDGNQSELEIIKK